MGLGTVMVDSGPASREVPFCTSCLIPILGGARTAVGQLVGTLEGFTPKHVAAWVARVVSEV